MTEAEFNSFFDVLQCTSEHLLEAMTSVQHLQSLQKTENIFVSSLLVAQTRFAQFVLAEVMKKIPSMSKGKIRAINF